MNWKPSFLLVLAFALNACRPQESSRSDPSQFPFSATNIVLDDGSPALVLHGTNGLSVEMGERRVTMYFGLSNTITAWFDPDSRRLTKLLLETADSEHGRGQWVTDLNADGVPDMRRIKGQNGNELFFKGQWCRSEPAGGTNTLAIVEGKKVLLYYDRRGWTEVPRAK
jgi:hypothetical protein